MRKARLRITLTQILGLVDRKRSPRRDARDEARHGALAAPLGAGEDGVPTNNGLSQEYRNAGEVMMFAYQYAMTGRGENVIIVEGIQRVGTCQRRDSRFGHTLAPFAQAGRDSNTRVNHWQKRLEIPPVRGRVLSVTVEVCAPDGQRFYGPGECCPDINRPQ